MLAALRRLIKVREGDNHPQGELRSVSNSRLHFLGFIATGRRVSLTKRHQKALGLMVNYRGQPLYPPRLPPATFPLVHIGFSLVGRGRIELPTRRIFSSALRLSRKKTLLLSRIRECVFAHGQKGFVVSGCLTRTLCLVVKWSSTPACEACQVLRSLSSAFFDKSPSLRWG